MKKTKIVCTLGPASSTKKIIAAMADAGMNVVRLNFSHGLHEEHAEKIRLVKEVREEKHIPLPIILDTKGPEFRIKTFKNGKIELKEGDTFSFTTEEVEGDQHRVGVFERGAFVRGRDTVFDLHKEHIPHDAQSFGCQSQSEHWVGQVRVPWVLVVLRGVLHIVLHDFVAHSLTCPVP